MFGRKHISNFALIRVFDFQSRRKGVERDEELSEAETDVVVLVPFQLFCALHVSYFGVLTLWFLLSD